MPGRVAGRLTPPAVAVGGTVQLGSGQASTLESGGNRATQLKRMLSEKIKAEPESASRLVQGWVQQEGQR